MIRMLLHWFVNAVVLLVVARLVPGFVVTNFGSALIAVVVIGLFNATFGLLLKVITLPLGILTLGLFFLVINALMLEFASRLVPGFYVRSFGAAFIGACILAVLHMILGAISGALALRVFGGKLACGRRKQSVAIKTVECMRAKAEAFAYPGA